MKRNAKRCVIIPPRRVVQRKDRRLGILSLGSRVLPLLSLLGSGSMESTAPCAPSAPAREQQEHGEHTNYIGSSMPTSGASCSNHFVARLSSLGIAIAFYLPRCLSPAHILRRTPSIYP